MALIKSVSVAAGMALFAVSCGSGNESAAFCDAVADLSSLDAMESVYVTAEDPGAEMMEAFSKLKEAFATMEAAAPSEIEEDLKLLSEGFGTFADALEKVDGDIFAIAADPELTERMEALDGPEFDKATKNIEEYARTECEVELG